jgi:hypothetical protein
MTKCSIGVGNRRDLLIKLSARDYGIAVPQMGQGRAALDNHDIIYSHWVWEA